MYYIIISYIFNMLKFITGYKRLIALPFDLSSINLNSKSNSIRASRFWKKDKTQKMLKVAFVETKN